MLLALDEHGNVIRASSASKAHSYRYKCLDCKAPVFLKRGNIQQPHFAHRARKAKEDCQYYHKGYDRLPYIYKSVDLKSRHSKYSYISSDLYCRGGLDSEFELCLLFPNASSLPAWSGKIAVNGGKWGQFELSWPQLCSSRYVPIPFCESIQLIVNFMGYVDEYYKETIQYVRGLDQLVNCFLFTDTYGRRLRQDERLYWGEKYWILMKKNTPKPPDSIEIIKEALADNWTRYLIKLPHFKDLSAIAREEISEWLTREISLPDQVITVINPLLLRIASDGAYIVPNDTEYVILAKTGDKQLSALGNTGNEMAIEKKNDDLYEISLDSDEVNIYQDNKLISIFRKGLATHFNPHGVEVIINAEKIPIFTVKQFIFDNRPDNISIKIESPDEKINKVISINGDQYDRINKTITEYLINDGKVLINGENFGEIRLSIFDNTRKLNDLTLEYSELIKLLFGLASTKHDQAVSFPNTLVSNAPDWLRRLGNLRWGSNHIHYINRLLKAINGVIK